MAATDTADSLPWSILIKAIPYLIAVKLLILLGMTWNTRFVMDEFVQLGQAKYLGRGLFDTIWPVKAVGYTVFYKLAHIAGWNATSILLIGRMLTVLLGAAVLAMVYSCARSLGATKERALVAVLVLLSFSSFIEQIFRTRSEPLAVFFAVAALLVTVRGSADGFRRVAVAGILSGLAFVTTQKSIYFNVALGAGLVVDAVLAGRPRAAFVRGAWLVLGWTIPLVAYCIAFGGTDPFPVLVNLFFGPADLVTEVPKAYPDLPGFIVQTLKRNPLLYAACVLAMVIAVRRFRAAPSPERIALVFSVLITVLVFAHNQPWPYVFVMALPFMAMWIPALLEAASRDPRDRVVVGTLLALAVAFSFARNMVYFQLDNAKQLEAVSRAERLLAPSETYFDGNGMLPNRSEPSTLWLDVPLVIRTLAEGERSEAYRIFTETPPKLVIWSYRIDAIEPVVGGLIRDSYVRVAPNIWLAGQRLVLGRPVTFDASIAGRYRLYDSSGRAISGGLALDGAEHGPSVELERGTHQLLLREGASEALLLPEGDYVGLFARGGDDPALFAGVYS